MEARKNPAYLRSVAKAVEDFRDALRSFLELHVVNHGMGPRGIVPDAIPRDDADSAEIERRAAKVSRAAGRAAAATPLTGITMGVQGVGAVDPITNWQTITQPKPLLEASNVLGMCDFALGRLEGLILEAEASQPPTIGAAAMHPAVWGQIEALWRDGHYREAVAAAGESVAMLVKNRTGRNDIPETSLWQEAFSDKPPAEGKPRLRWPGNPSDRSVTSMTDGLRKFAPGVQMTIRNGAAHSVGQMAEQDALERLAVLSLLARWVDECELILVEQEPPSEAEDGAA